jgi:two-component system, LytTR family, sensor kinase
VALKREAKRWQDCPRQALATLHHSKQCVHKLPIVKETAVPQYEVRTSLTSSWRTCLANNLNKKARRIGYPGFFWLWLTWTLIGALAFGRHYLEKPSAVPSARLFFEFLIWLTCFYPWIAFAPLVFRLERRYPLGTRRWAANAGRLLAAALPLAFLGAVLTQFLYASVHVLFRQPRGLSFNQWQGFPRELGFQMLFYWTTVGAAYVIRNLIQLHERDKQAVRLALEKSQLETTLRRAELETLQARLNPHFLFNCLQNISALTREDPKTAVQMLARLGTLLRTALRRDGTPETTLASEIDLTKSYVAVEKVRFADRLMVEFDIPNDSESALVPALLLQPLVENAILHGLQGTNRAGVISIRSAIESGSLVLTVVDNGVGLDGPNPSAREFGIGLTSTCERLEKLYPQQHSFSIRSLPEGGTEVQVSLPLRLGIARVEDVAHEQTALVGRR